jgi:hypothetical protein
MCKKIIKKGPLKSSYLAKRLTGSAFGQKEKPLFTAEQKYKYKKQELALIIRMNMKIKMETNMSYSLYILVLKILGRLAP